MAETIKGINVVIGAETTGLSKALADVNKRGRDLQSELKQIEKLLKLDPTNTELLAQKTKLLGDAVENTREKLNRLRIAQEQVNEQFAKGQISEGQFRAFQREIVKTEQELKRFENQLAALDDPKALDNLKKQFHGVSKEADEAKEAIKGVGSEIGSLVGGLAAGGGIAGAISKALDSASLQTSIDITMDVPPESVAAVRDAVNTVNSYIEDQAAALEGVRRQWALNADASDEANARIVQGAAAIARAYAGIDFVELIQETNEIANSLKISNDEALGLVNSLLKIGFPPEQLDIISEYGTQLKMAGYEAEEIRAIFAAGVDTGTWNIDNLLDGLKEGRIRLAEFGQEVPKATKDLLASTNISAAQLQKWGQAVAAGGEAGKKAMLEVAQALMNVENETTRNALGVQIFGTMWEDQGTNIAQTLLNMENHLTSLKGTQDQLNDSVERLNADPAIRMKQAMADLREALTPLLGILAEIIAKIAEWISEHPKLAAAITAVGSAAAILGGALAALGPLFVGLMGAGGIAGLGAALGGLAAAGGPVVLAIAALGALGFGAYKLAEDLKQPSLQAQVFSDEISQATQEAVGSFLELNDQATVALNQLAWSGQAVTSEMASSIISTFDQMGDQIMVAMQEDHAAQLQTMQDFFANSAALTEEEEAKILEKMQKHQEEQAKTVTEGQARIAEILTTAAEEKRAITEAERAEINRIQKEMTESAVQYLTENEREQRVILERLKTEASKITAEQAAEVVKNSTAQKDKVIADAEEQYKKTIAEIIKQRDEAKTITAEQADKLIQEAKRQRDETVKQAEDMHRKVVEEAKKQAGEHVNQVDWTTGEIKSKWQIMKENISSKMSEIGQDIREAWQGIMEYLEGIDLEQTGKDIMEGLREGIGGMARSIWDKAKEIGRGIINSIRRELDTHSPSRVMIGIGEDTAEGLRIGLESMINDIRKTAEKLAGAAVPAVSKLNVGYSLDSVPGAPAAAGGGSINQYITINSPEPLSPSEIARRNLQVSRQLAMEWGLS